MKHWPEKLTIVFVGGFLALSVVEPPKTFWNFALGAMMLLLGLRAVIGLRKKYLAELRAIHDARDKTGS